MQLNLPVIDQLMSCKHLLIAGMGGGFDVFCGLPIYFELQRRGQQAHLASFSFADIAGLQDGVRLTDTLVGVTADQKDAPAYFPEHCLAQWFRERRHEDKVIWSLHTTGARPLLENYRALIDRLSLDGILLIDGGVDSLMRGDEAEWGTVIEDATSLSAVSELAHVPIRLIACIGFGAEQEVTHAHVMENIAALAEGGGFLGSCSLIRQMEAYQAYEEAVLYANRRSAQSASVINASVISAVQGRYGDFHLTDRTRGSQLWISPFMSIYWFFDLLAVAQRNLLLSDLRTTETFSDAFGAVYLAREKLRVRAADRIPLR